MASFPKPPFVLLDDSRSQNRDDAGLLFSDPKAVLECRDLAQVGKTIEKIAAYQKQGGYLAGWISYECGLPFHPTLKRARPRLSEEPLIWLGVFRKPRVLPSRALEKMLEFQGRPAPAVGKLAAGESPKQFERAFRKIKRHIEAGDAYQINHTFPLACALKGAAILLYRLLRKIQPVPYGAYIDTGEWRVLSLSPELFLARRGDTLTSCPMKGTAPAGRTWPELCTNKKALARDPKNRAENLMITDLIRNDLSRISKPGTVAVEHPFRVERFGQVLQMTTQVKSELHPGITFSDIFPALFPCGSVTGAPKIRAMEIIRETERQPRGLYTGAIGSFAPGGDFTLNVPIRTLVLGRSGTGRFGVGSGIVADSTFHGEYEECLLKARFLNSRPQRFGLLETLLWDPDTGFALLGLHLERLLASARYFDFAVDKGAVVRALDDAAKDFPSGACRRVRLVCSRQGKISIEHRPFDRARIKEPVRLSLSRTRVDPRERMLFHKTTDRRLYAKAFSKLQKKAKVYDVLLRNQAGNITEGTFTNIFFRKGKKGALFTPPVSEGLLPGVLRRRLLDSGKVKEAPLTPEIARRGYSIYVGNSLTGLLAATVVRSS